MHPEPPAKPTRKRVIRRIAPSASKHTRKRTTAERERDLVETARLYLARKTQQQIADELAVKFGTRVSRSQIALDIQELQKRWVQQSVEALDVRKAEELARIDALESEYRDRFDASKRDRKRTVSQHSGKPVNGTVATPSHVSVTVTQEESDGDPRWLAGVQWCIEQRAKILGIVAPTRIANADGSKIEPMTHTAVVCYLPDNGRASDSPNPIPKPS